MRRNHAYSLSLGLVTAIIGYAGWTLWSPDLAIKYHENVDGSWQKAEPNKGNPMIGRIFQ